MQVYGVDIAPDCSFEEERIKTFIFSSLDKDACDENLSNLSFDIIVDDGSHLAEDQLATMQNLFDRVRIGGYYAIEHCGGNGPHKYIIQEYNKEFREIADGHEYLNYGNVVFIRKNNSGKGNLGSLDNFLKRAVITYKKWIRRHKKVDLK